MIGGPEVPFCKHAIDLEINEGEKDLAEAVTVSIIDRGKEVGQLRLKLSTLLAGGKFMS